jgi:hypothetical protein
MNAEIKKLWVEDLRQNPDLQGTGSLRKGDKFCCLGRLCEVFKNQSSQGDWDHNNDFVLAGHRDNGVLPVAVAEWAGLDDVNPSATPPEDTDGRASLAELNDSGHYTFVQLADIIEEQL